MWGHDGQSPHFFYFFCHGKALALNSLSRVFPVNSHSLSLLRMRSFFSIVSLNSLLLMSMFCSFGTHRPCLKTMSRFFISLQYRYPQPHLAASLNSGYKLARVLSAPSILFFALFVRNMMANSATINNACNGVRWYIVVAFGVIVFML